MAQPVFRARAFVSWIMLVGFLCLACSGIALFSAPSGGSEQAQAWRFLWLDKRSWVALHIVFASLFLCGFAAHLTLNGRALTGYLRRRLLEGAWPRLLAAMRLEFVAALLVCALFGASALERFAPATLLFELHGAVAGQTGRQGEGHRYGQQNQKTDGPAAPTGQADQDDD